MITEVNDPEGKPRAPIFLVDDEPRLLLVLEESLSTLGVAVRAFSTPADCLRELASSPCSVLVTDFTMPGMDGLELLQEVRAIRPFLPVIIITGFGDVPLAVRALKEGAFDFIEKPIDEKVFLDKVREALERSAESHLDVQSLTETERKVLEMVAAGGTNKEIAHQIGRSIRTVENHRYRLMHKLGVESTAELAKLAVAMGLTGGGSPGKPGKAS